MSIFSRIFGPKRDYAANRAARVAEVESLMDKLRTRLGEINPRVELRRDHTHFHATLNGCGAAVPFGDIKNDFDASVEFITRGLNVLQGLRGE